METKQAIIVLADIGGYTKFITLHTMSLLHAEKIVTELIEAIVENTNSPLVLNKFEGDAVLFYAETGNDPQTSARNVLSQTVAFLDAFNARSKELTGCNNLCPCDACRQGDQLRLKTVIHYGEIAVKEVRGFVELAGPEVILAHRLLKNSIESDQYVLTTEPFSQLAEPTTLDTETRTEHYEGFGPVNVRVHYPPGNSNSSAAPTKRRNIARSLSNAVRLDAYAFARALGMIKAPAESALSGGSRPRFWNLSMDGLRGLWMIYRGK